MVRNRFCFLGLLLVLVICSQGLMAQNGSGSIDLNDLYNYADQPIPNYIMKDNTPVNNVLTDAGATLGRVIFYDKRISVDNTVACASCHQQEFAFADTAVASVGVNGSTGRHSMRLINARFSDEERFFWDERAVSLEDQTTRPIQDHAEMGFSGENGDPAIDSLFNKMAELEYYQSLFHFVYGDSQITEARMQQVISQFIRSIQSFDSRYDEGRSTAPNDGAPFPNFTMTENQGKMLYLAPPQIGQNGIRTGGGLGCAGCHRPPEFDIDPNSGNNGEVVALDGGVDYTNTRAPSLRDITNSNGELNGGLMHNASINSLSELVDHYNFIPVMPGNIMLDPRLRAPGPPGNNNPRDLNVTETERQQLIAFLETLTGTNVYLDEKWSNPFDSDGNLVVIPEMTTGIETDEASLVENFTLEQNYPNPFNPSTTIAYQLPEAAIVHLTVYDVLGRKVATLVNQRQNAGRHEILFNADGLNSGIYFYHIRIGQQILETRKMLLAR